MVKLGTSGPEHGENQTHEAERASTSGDRQHSPVVFTDLETLRRHARPESWDRPHRTTGELVLRIRSGQATHDVDFARHLLTVGDVLWLRAGQVHRWGDPGAIEADALRLSAGALPAETEDLVARLGARRRSYWPAAAVEGSPLGEAFQHAFAWSRALARSPIIDRHVRDAALTEIASGLVLQLAGDSPAPAAAGDRLSAFAAFVALIDSRFADTRSVADYAKQLGVSERTLVRASRLHAGATPKELIDRRVILEAKRMLAHGSGPVAQIGAELGFDDPANFSAYFRHRVGVAPGAFRGETRERLSA